MAFLGWAPGPRTFRAQMNHLQSNVANILSKWLVRWSPLSLLPRPGSLLLLSALAWPRPLPLLTGLSCECQLHVVEGNGSDVPWMLAKAPKLPALGCLDAS